MEDDSSSSKLQLCLTWNSFTDNIINSLESSYGDGDFVDVTLACEGESIKAHKLVLSACSQYLKRLLKENPCQHPIIILKDVGLAELKDLLVYMYHGEVRVEQDRIAKLLHTAQILEIQGLRDINQRLDQELDSSVNETTSLGISLSEGTKNRESSADNYNGSQQNSVTSNSGSLQAKSVNLISKGGTTVKMCSELKPPPGKKPRPLPMLQCIQQSGKPDGNSVTGMSLDRDEDEVGEEESNHSSLAPDHTVFLEEVRVKEEKPDTSEQLDDFVTNQSSTMDENSSDAEPQEFNNGYSNSAALPTPGGESLSRGLFAAHMLKRVATRASSSEAVATVRDSPSLGSILLNSSVTDQAGSATRTQEETRSDEVTVSLFGRNQRWKTSSTVQSSASETDKKKQLMDFRPWGILNVDLTIDEREQSGINSDLSSDKLHENVRENMDIDSPQLPRKETFFQSNDREIYRATKHVSNQEFSRPTEYVPKEGKICSRYQTIEQMLNISPQLRLQMLMCREYKKYTNILLVAMFGREMLATHSLNGTGTSKPRLDIEKVNHVIEAVMTKFGVDQHHVKEAIRIKLNNEDKLKKRLSQKVSTGVGVLQ